MFFKSKSKVKILNKLKGMKINGQDSLLNFVIERLEKMKDIEHKVDKYNYNDLNFMQNLVLELIDLRDTEKIFDRYSDEIFMIYNKCNSTMTRTHSEMNKQFLVFQALTTILDSIFTELQN